MQFLIILTIVIVIAVIAGEVSQKRSPTNSNFLIFIAILVGAYGMSIAPFVKGSINEEFIYYGLISMCYIFAFVFSPIVGALVAYNLSVRLIRMGNSSLKINLIVGSVTFLIGLFLFRFEGCF